MAGRPAVRAMERVSSWTISPGREGLRPLGSLLAQGRLRRAARGAFRRIGDGEDVSFFDEGFEDAAHRAFAGVEALALDEDGDFGLSPHGVVVAGLAHGRDQRRRPLRPAHAAGAARERFEAPALGAFSPSVEGRQGHSDRSRRRAGVQAVLAGPFPAFEGVASVRPFATLSGAQTRRQACSLCNLSRQANNLHGGLRRLFRHTKQLRRPPPRLAPSLTCV